MLKLALVYIQWHQSCTSPEVVCFLLSDLMGFIHQHQSMSWICFVLYAEAFVYQGFDMSNGGVSFA
jgi:hypothetical protein